MSRPHVTGFPDPRRILASLQRARVASVATVTSGQESGLVKLRGTAQPGAEVLTAPISQAPCVWYRSVVSRFDNNMPTPTPFLGQEPPDFAPSDLPAVRTSLMHDPDERLSTAPFRIADGSASILVEPAGADVDSSVLPVNRFVPVPGVLSTRTLEQEWIIPVGAPLFALGTAYRDGTGWQLRATPDDVLLVSTKDEQQIGLRNETGARYSWLSGTSAGRSTGVRGSLNALKWALISSAVLTVLVLVAILVIVLR